MSNENKSFDSYDINGFFSEIKKDFERKEQTLRVVLSALKYMESTGEKVDIKGIISDIEKVLKPNK